MILSIPLQREVAIIAGPASSELASRVAKNMDAELVPVDLKIFPDGENKIRFRNVSKKYCIIVQSTYPPVDRHLIQTFMMVRKCRDDGANGICAVVPYIGYSRQDRAFLDGEVISMAVIAKLLEDSGVQQIQTVDIHSLFALSHFKIKTQNITSIPLLANFVIEKLKLQKPMVVSPDAGGLKRAEEFAKILKTDVIALEKNRDRITGNVSINQDIDIDLTDRAAVIIDDMISSGGSIIKACQLLKKKGAEKVYAMCTHGLLLGDAKEKIMSAGIQDIISTNSIPNETAKVDLSSIITSNLRARIQVQ